MTTELLPRFESGESLELPIDRYGILFDPQTDPLAPEFDGLRQEVRNLFLDDEFPYTIHDFPKLDCNGWDNEDYKTFGRRLHLITFADEHRSLTYSIIHRSYVLGFGPSEERIRRPSRFGTLWRFNEAIGKQYGYARQRYTDLTVESLMEYGRELGGPPPSLKPTEEMIHTAFQEGEGPSVKMHLKVFDTMSRYYAELGFSSRGRTKEDDIELGALLLASGDVSRLSTPVIRHLSRLDRLSSEGTTILRHGSIPNLHSESAARAELLTAQEIEEGSRPFPKNRLVVSGPSGEAELVHSLQLATLNDTAARVTHLLSVPATRLLAELVKQPDAPTVTDDLAESYPNTDWTPEVVRTAWEELTRIEALAGHLLEITDDSQTKKEFTILQRSGDLGLLCRRVDAIFQYLHPRSPEENNDTHRYFKIKQRLGAIASSESGRTTERTVLQIARAGIN